MRPIDTAALEAVAKSLGVGAPITALGAVDFDDQNLQQVLDVGPLTRYAAAVGAGVPSQDGWALVNVTLSMLTGIGLYATQVAFNQANLDRIRLPTGGSTFWIYAVSGELVASVDPADFAGGHATVEIPTDCDTQAAGGVNREIPIAFFNYQFLRGSATVATMTGDGSQAYSAWPIAAPLNSIFRVYGRQIAAAGTLALNVSIFGRILPTGVCPSAF